MLAMLDARPEMELRGVRGFHRLAQHAGDKRARGEECWQ